MNCNQLTEREAIYYAFLCQRLRGGCPSRHPAAFYFCWQGMFYLVAKLSSTAISEALMAELLIVGGLMIVASGLSLLKLKDCKTLNMLPALLVPVLWFLVRGLV